MPKYILSFLLILLSFLPNPELAVGSVAGVSTRIAAFDPAPGETLGFYDKLYLEIDYETEIPLRFRLAGLRDGNEIEFGSMPSPATLHLSGDGETLAWLSFSTATRIDEVRVDVLDSDWNKIDQLGINMEIAWHSPSTPEMREPAPWVAELMRKDRHKQEHVFDPTPTEEESVYDFFFFLSAFTIPIYLFLQVHSLKFLRGRWRELSIVPIISVVPMFVFSLVGLGMDLRLWVMFMFRGMPLALLYLIVIWAVKISKDRKSAK